MDYLAPRTTRKTKVVLDDLVVPKGVTRTAFGNNFDLMIQDVKRNVDYIKISVYENEKGLLEIDSHPSNINWLSAAKAAGIKHLEMDVQFLKRKQSA